MADLEMGRGLHRVADGMTEIQDYPDSFLVEFILGDDARFDGNAAMLILMYLHNALKFCWMMRMWTPF